MAATGIPYVFTAIEGYGTDLVAKAAKAQWYARNEGLAYGKILVACPVNWSSDEKYGYEILQRAVDCCFFPTYEIEHGLTSLSYDPDAQGRRIPVRNWLEIVGRSKHLLKPGAEVALNELQSEVDRRWNILKARAAHPLL
jgi:pyruvate ferredoxin oxidoreductase alpha subunit